MIEKELVCVSEDCVYYANWGSDLIYRTTQNGDMQRVDEVILGGCPYRTFEVVLLPEEQINFDLRLFFKSKKITVLTNKEHTKWGYIFNL